MSDIDCDTDDVSFCVNAKDITNYIKAVNDIFISLISDDNKSLTIKHNKGKAKFPMSDSNEFPKVELDKDVTLFETDSETLYNWISMGRNFVGVDELRPQMCGIYLYAKDGEYGCCATDSMSLFTDNKRIDSDVEFGVVINRNSFASILSLLGRDESVSLRIGTKNVVMTCGDSKLIVHLIEGRFPNFHAVIPKNQSLNVSADKKSLLDTIQRVSIAGNKVSGLIKLLVDGTDMNVTAQDIDYSTSASENIVCKSNGNITIGLKSERLISCINAISSENITLGMTDATKAVTIRDTNDMNKVLLLMPMILND
jgi:DNA polymerase III, beta subunit